jgi:hypothetical protein
LKKANQNDYKRFINKVSATDEGEVAENDFYFIDKDAIEAEEAFDGFYAVCTNLEDDVAATGIAGTYDEATVDAAARWDRTQERIRASMSYTHDNLCHT